MLKFKNTFLTTTAGFLLVISLCSCSNDLWDKSKGNTVDSANKSEPLRMAISPYQDTAFLVNVKDLALEKKYSTKIELLTLQWENILPAIASAGQTADIGYASLTDYLTKSENINSQTDDPVLFIYPTLVFKGLGFVTFNPSVPDINSKTVHNSAVIKKFLTFKIGAAKNSMSQMLLYMLAKKAGIKFSDLSIIDTTVNDGLLAAENGSLDIAAAGVTQRTEALKRHGRVVLSMDVFGIGDIDGFVCKESVYKRRWQDINSLIKMQFDCENYVLNDLDHHSANTLAYLRANASTKYTLAEFRQALTHQYFPASPKEVEQDIISSKGKYSINKQTAVVNKYLLDIGAIKAQRPVPKLIDIN